ncbi:hypothetical protein AGMMS49938_16890 [Fibrobacterales bacterium]|nr:hypothetical protein AGMMS49938_16890 [Fibrobacterales bacterium]
MSSVQVATRIDKKIKNAAGEVFAHYGLDLPAALRMFITITANERRIPLEISKRSVSLDGDNFESDQKYFEQITGFLEKLDSISNSSEWYSAKEAGWKL